eukprot:TRINITY_DN432_c2_g1_i1.p1 TRINITY_DN432_c2_g1~~TRINITY_DN432_c2_g1_i1.p1  ORF type:complete len:278 (+),score=92.01 TRINITY_DN432_c2_g1_i1:63-836(+)
MSDIDNTPAPAPAADAAPAEPRVLDKVFIGNLSFETTEDTLKELFAVAGTVVSAHIISRGPRSLGYGFIQMGSADEALVAVEKLDKNEIDGRAVNVQVAKAEGGGAGGDGTRPRGRRGRGRGGRGGAAAEGDAEGAAAAPRGGRRERAERVPSDTTLFVANLPFSVDDEALAAIFEGLNVKTAHVARKNRNRSKGYGFVEFENSADQQAGLSAIDNKEVDGRMLSVKIALSETAAADAAASSAAAAAAASEAPVATE